MKKIDHEQIQQMAFQLILHAGNGRSYSLRAIQAAKKGDFEQADQLLQDAEKELEKAHQAQVSWIQTEAEGVAYPVNLLLIHAQDHLMTALTVKDLALEIVELYQRR